MRIWLRIPDESLRRALSDLLSHAGHDVSTAASPAPRADLHVVAGAGEGDAPPAPGAAVLVLGGRPSPQGTPDPATSLARVLERGGTVSWPSPLEPGRLLAALARKGERREPRLPDEVSPDAPIAAAHDPWFVLDPDRRVVLWANATARARLGHGDDPWTEVLRRLPLAAVAGAVFERSEGRRRVEHAGRPVLAVWWTDTRGRRVLGLVEVPVAAREDPHGNLRTLAEIGRLSTTLAHEIRNPLAALAGALDLLGEDSDPTERAEVLDLARRRLVQMRTLLDDTLRLARPFKAPPAPLDLAAVARSAVAGVRTDALFRGVELREDYGTDSPTAVGHEEPLRQAITNLLLNAAQAQDGEGAITVRLRVEGGWAVLRVADEGPGVPPEHREKVFEPFWTTKTSGTGLGLSFVRRAADAAGGRVVVEDSARGACFRLELLLAT
jgi:signal transduction histidine kinase